MVKLNRQMRDEKSEATRECVAALQRRTSYEITRRHDIKNEDWIEWFDDFDVCLQERGIHISKQNMMLVAVSGENNGGFTKEERTAVHKTYPSTWCEENKEHHGHREVDGQRRVQRHQTDNPAATVVCNEDGDVVLIHLQNVLSTYVVQQRNAIRNKTYTKVKRGWMKSCGISGVINLPETRRIIEKNSMARHGYFGRNHAEYTYVTVEPKKGRNGSKQGTSACCKYLNRMGKPRSFQMGNYIQRAIFQVDCPMLRGNRYAVMIGGMIASIGHLVAFPEYLVEPQNVKHICQESLQDTDESNTSIAINYTTTGDPSPLSLHYDKTVFGTCAATAEPDGRLTTLSSVDLNFGADAGEFFHEIGGLLHGYGSRDVILFNGIHMHAPMMPFPRKARDESKGIQQKAGRHSYIVFRHK
jgi:hypothetical protein